MSQRLLVAVYQRYFIVVRQPLTTPPAALTVPFFNDHRAGNTGNAVPDHGQLFPDFLTHVSNAFNERAARCDESRTRWGRVERFFVASGRSLLFRVTAALAVV